MTTRKPQASRKPRRSSAKPPTPAEILQGRKRAGLTKTAAAEKVHSIYRTWQQWEQGDRQMHPAFWELFLVKTGQIKI